MHVQNILGANHRPNAECRKPEIALLDFWGDLEEQIAFPRDVVVDVHDADDCVQDPDDEEDDPVGLAGGFAAEAICDGPGYHADEGGWLGMLVGGTLIGVGVGFRALTAHNRWNLQARLR